MYKTYITWGIHSILLRSRLSSSSLKQTKLRQIFLPNVFKTRLQAKLTFDSTVHTLHYDDNQSDR